MYEPREQPLETRRVPVTDRRGALAHLRDRVVLKGERHRIAARRRQLPTAAKCPAMCEDRTREKRRGERCGQRAQKGLRGARDAVGKDVVAGGGTCGPRDP